MGKLFHIFQNVYLLNIFILPDFVYLIQTMFEMLKSPEVCKDKKIIMYSMHVDYLV